MDNAFSAIHFLLIGLLFATAIRSWSIIQYTRHPKFHLRFGLLCIAASIGVFVVTLLYSAPTEETYYRILTFQYDSILLFLLTCWWFTHSESAEEAKTFSFVVPILFLMGIGVNRVFPYGKVIFNGEPFPLKTITFMGESFFRHQSTEKTHMIIGVIFLLVLIIDGAMAMSTWPKMFTQKTKMVITMSVGIAASLLFADAMSLFSGAATPYSSPIFIPISMVVIGVMIALENRQNIQAIWNTNRHLGLEISRRQELEQELRQQNQVFRQVHEASRIGTWIFDIKTKEMTWNEQTRQIFEIDDLPIIRSADYWKAIHPEDYDKVRKVGDEGQDKGSIEVEHRIVVGDKVRWVRVFGFFDQGDDPQKPTPRALGTIQDITPTKSLEANLAQAQKMDAIGNLAGGIAHDFNNILQSILGYAELMAGSPDLPESERKNLDRILLGSERAAHLTKQLLAFSRREVLRVRPVSFNHMVEEALDLLRPIMGHKVNLVWQPIEKVVKVKIDTNHMSQVIMNLCINARDAMPHGGDLIISGKYLENKVVLSVQDTGIGMAPEVAAQMFDPFFTTKGEKGTGLGLSMVHGLVIQHGGQVEVESRLGKGTTIRIILPSLVEEV